MEEEGTGMFTQLTSFEGSLFDEFRRLQSDMDELFGQSAWPAGIRSLPRGAFPAVNVGVTPEKVDVYVFAAGLDPKSIEVSIQQNLLTISGEREVSFDENAKYYRQERFSGDFRRVLTLPDDIDPDQVEASYREGLLQISVKRREAARARQIAVQ
jgi:HSP20 family protein